MSGEFVIALHALIYLKHHKYVISSDALAKNICTNAARVRKVMAKLKKANLISTAQGIKGGYIYNDEIESLDLGQIANALDEKLIPCNWFSGQSDMECIIASGMGCVIKDLQDELNRFCIKKLGEIPLVNLEKKLFTKDKK